MKFLVDAQLPPALAAFLRDKGFEAIAVRDADLRQSSDQQIWNYALNHQFIILTKDEDFAQRSTTSTKAPVIIWLRVGNTTNPHLFQWITPRWPQIETCLNSGEKLIEVR